MAEITENNNVLVIGAAGNSTGGASCGSDGHGYAYPGAYNSAISVTAVGHRFPIGNVDPVFGAGAWEDCHKNIPESSTSEPFTHNDKVNISAPGWHVLRASEANSYTNVGSGTSQSAPIVSGVAALVFAVNPNLTAQQAKDIILNTADDIYHIPYNQDYIGLLGTGRVNAYRAVLTAKCMDDPNYEPTLDLMVKNSLDDFGEEPDNNTGEVLWHSSDIWVRNQAGESYIRTHQNPEYDPNDTNYVYVRVTNRSCVTSSGSEELKLYWAKANTNLIWEDSWNGSLTIGNNIPLGDEIGTLSIPSLDPGEEAILEFPWMVPNPEDYIGLNPNPWHFCLLARIETLNDPMTFPEGTFIPDNVRNNNNIAWKNTTVVDIEPNTVGIGGVIGVSNPTDQTKIYRLEFVVDANENGKAVYEEAEVGVEMDEVLFEAWERGGKTGSRFKTTANEKKIVATDDNMIIDNIQFDPNEYGTAYITFNFLTKELTDKVNYTYHVIQKDVSDDSTVGGETYTIRKKSRPAFLANAGNDEIVEKNETITLQASQINEDAVYNWYDPDGNLIYTGTDLTVSPEVTQQYKLEIISDLDGLKDYDEVSVTVTPYSLGNLIPNPATTQVTVNYTADEAGSAYIMVVNQTTAASDNYILDTQEESITIDISSYPSGLYSVILVCDGEVQSIKTLAKE